MGGFEDFVLWLGPQNNNSERPVDVLAEKHISLTDNLKSRDASAYKKKWPMISFGIEKKMGALSMNELFCDRSFSRDLSLFRLAVPAFTQCPTTNFGPAPR